MSQKVKTIKDDGYSIVMNQCLKVGTHIFSMGTAHSNYPIMERVITDEFCVDSYGYPCVILKDVETGVISS